MNASKITNDELYELFELKYGHPDTTGWSPRRRLKWGYYPPGDIYECTIKKMITPATKWLDVGGGRAIFPHNEKLSQILADKCKKIVAVDPSENVYENPYADERIKSMLEDFQTDEKFDIATFRMVAEHIENPESVLEKLNSIIKPGGYVVIYTINKYSPIPIITFITPFSWHFKIKKFIWGGDEKDTFPVAYKMNSRKELKTEFNKKGFNEVTFYHLDDLSTFSRFKILNLLELSIWKFLKMIRVRYPENNLLGIYQRQTQ